MRLSQVAEVLDAEVVRDGEFASLGLVSHVAPSMLVFLESRAFLASIPPDAHVSCVLCTPELRAHVPSNLGVAVVTNPRRSFYQLHNYLAAHTTFYWSHFPTRTAPSAQVHPTAFVADQDVLIGERAVIEARATVLPRVIVGEEATIRSGAVIGSEGFQAFLDEGHLVRVLHGGGVRLGRAVEIQSNTCVDRALFGGFTEVGDECLIDNLVHVAHNVRMGPRCRVAANAMIGGSAVLGAEVWVGPSASISSEITVGDRAFITLGAVVTRNVDADARVSGNFAIKHERFLAFVKSIR